MKQINITVGILVPVQVEVLMLDALLSYYGLTKEELFAYKSKCEPARKRGILYYLIKFECNKSETDIAELYKVTRQSVNKSIGKIEYEVNKELYLQNRCDTANIKTIFSNLLKEQKSWLERVSQ